MGKRGPEKQPLDWRHREAMFLAIYRWYNKTEICEDLGISRMTLWKWEQREDYQKEYLETRKDYWKRWHSLRRENRRKQKKAMQRKSKRNKSA
ncbi:phBC6A51 family helix-turn-helix protein [Pontibacillus salipaludis]|uniref:Homeodomain phBC6A51-type domain-containing protein n=1 Tax=Pontibacillus salipaludis TaxID=1697394 RepID=A0ABQ1PZE1_9BACI|nr:phBC6A51 family helix-turn-helix protein [Pontibacillus salipaludis]GGD07882.1 hypothetical protein GCM10011389_14270 [Pontibacillus salipaludis]